MWFVDKLGPPPGAANPSQQAKPNGAAKSAAPQQARAAAPQAKSAPQPAPKAAPAPPPADEKKKKKGWF
jgi:hypothetical protein